MKLESLAKLTFISTIVAMLLSLAAVGAVVYIIWHFLARVW